MYDFCLLIPLRCRTYCEHQWMVELFELVFLLPPPSSAPLCSPPSIHLHPPLCSHCYKFCVLVAFSKQPPPSWQQVWPYASVSWCFLCWQGPLGPTIAQLSAALALPLLPLCCPSSFQPGLVSSVSPTMLLGEHFYGPYLLLHFMKWYSGQSVHTLNILSRMEALCFNPKH